MFRTMRSFYVVLPQRLGVRSHQLCSSTVNSVNLVVVVGPTASGKSDLGIQLAKSAANPRGEVIVNADSMQLYRGLDVGTAKTPLAERDGVEHLLLDVLDVEQEASVAKFQAESRQRIVAAAAAGKTVVAVGGSGLYIRALVDRLEFPGTSPRVRQLLEKRERDEGSVALHAELQKKDPESALRIHPNNGRRIIRALEVIEITGRPFSASLPGGEYFFPNTVQLAVDWPVEELDQRINERTQQIFSGGIVEETRALLDAGHTFGKTAASATGYRQALGVLSGELSQEEAVDQVALATRQLARRQLKWFRKDPRIVWLTPGEGLLDRATQAIEECWGHPLRAN